LVTAKALALRLRTTKKNPTWAGRPWDKNMSHLFIIVGWTLAAFSLLGSFYAVFAAVQVRRFMRARHPGLQAPTAVTILKPLHGAEPGLFENLESFVSCFAAGSGCAVNGLCALKPALSGAVDAFLEHLDGFRLSDLVPDRMSFVERLERMAAA